MASFARPGELVGDSKWLVVGQRELGRQTKILWKSRNVTWLENLSFFELFLVHNDRCFRAYLLSRFDFHFPRRGWKPQRFNLPHWGGEHTRGLYLRACHGELKIWRLVLSTRDNLKLGIFLFEQLGILVSLHLSLVFVGFLHRATLDFNRNHRTHHQPFQNSQQQPNKAPAKHSRKL